MGLEWVLISLMTVVSLWLAMDARRESKRLQARLCQVAPRRSARRETNGDGDRAYWPLTTSAGAEGPEASLGPRH